MRSSSNITAGVILITLGVLFLLNELFNINFGDWWPVILIVVGVMILVNSRQRDKWLDREFGPSKPQDSPTGTDEGQ